MRKKLSKGKELKKLDTIFSRYIRLKHADHGDICICVTCGVQKHYKEMHAGHFIPRGCHLTRFDERNVHPQCCGCNTYRNGEQAKYLIYIENTYGREAVDELMELERQWKAGTPWVGIGEIRELQVKYKNTNKLL
jgi:hypothetical protein